MAELGVPRAHREAVRRPGLRCRLGAPDRVIMLVRRLDRSVRMRVRMVVVVIVVMIVVMIVGVGVGVVVVTVFMPVIVPVLAVRVGVSVRMSMGLVGRAAGALVAAGEQRLIHDLADRAGAAAALGTAAEAAIDLAGQPRAALRDDVTDLVVRQDIAGADDHGGRGFRYGWFSERGLAH